MSIAIIANDAAVVLKGIDWQTYEHLRDMPENRKIRMTYHEGVLELMSPSKRHERLGKLIGRMVEMWALEFKIPLQSCGSTTFRREAMMAGLEPDECYYVANERAVRDREDVDLSIDPPPDLAIEVDITSSSIDHLRIYAELGVPEVWRCDGETLEIHVLSGAGQYIEQDHSPTFPQLLPGDVMRFLAQRNDMDETSLIESFRTWIRTTIAPQ